MLRPKPHAVDLRINLVRKMNDYRERVRSDRTENSEAQTKF